MNRVQQKIFKEHFLLFFALYLPPSFATLTSHLVLLRTLLRYDLLSGAFFV